jgi:hypothetical protein
MKRTAARLTEIPSGSTYETGGDTIAIGDLVRVPGSGAPSRSYSRRLPVGCQYSVTEVDLRRLEPADVLCRARTHYS